MPESGSAVSHAGAARAEPVPPPVVDEPSPWFVQVLDYDANSWVSPAIFTRPSGVTILETAGASSMWLRRSADGWSREQAADAQDAVAVFDAAGVPWVIAGGRGEGTLDLAHGTTVETVMTSYDRYKHKASIALDATGAPHVCIATKGDHDEPSTLSQLVKVRGKWLSEAIPGHWYRCALVFGKDDSIYVGTDDGVAVKSAGAWHLDSFGGVTHVGRGPDGSIVAVTRRDRMLEVARLHDGTWTRAPLVSKPLGEIRKFAFAVDSHGLVHAVVEVTADPIAELRYVVEGTAGTTQIVGADAQWGLDIALDANDEPHVVYGRSWTDTSTADTIEYARLRASGDPAHGGRDDGGIIAACGSLVAEELGAEPLSYVAERQAKRLCQPFRRDSLPLDDLAKRCDAGSVDACLLAGALVSDHSRGALQLMEVGHQVCERKSDKRCWTTKTEVAEIGSFLPRLAADPDHARSFFDRACGLGSKVACFYDAWSPDVELTPIAKLCSPELPVACAYVLTKPEVVGEQQLLRDMRGWLDGACKTSARPTACVTLAYMQEAGLGGPAQPANALRSHLRACALYSPTSCIRLLAGPFGRPAAPKDIDADKLEEMLADQCSTDHDGDACLAYAAAHERGWGMAKDKDGATAILQKACDEQGLAKACSKLGRRLRK